MITVRTELPLREGHDLEQRERQFSNLLAINAVAAGKAEATPETQYQLDCVLIELLNKNSYLSELRDTLEEIIRRSNYNELQSLLRRLDYEIESDRQSQRSDELFNLVHKEVLSDLQHRFPALTPSELRICVLIKKGLRSKEIASALHLSKHTVDTHRKVIRRKVSASPELDLDAILGRYSKD